MSAQNLGGHSGCKILLMEDAIGRNFVRKFSRDIGYNARLEAQCDKQEKFKDDGAKAPAVLNQGISDDGLFYFDMEYIQGITLAERIKSVQIGEIRGLVKSIAVSLVSHERNCDTQGNAANAAFSVKIASLSDKLYSLADPVVDASLELLASHDWSLFAPSYCHGDLTLENVIVSKGQLYFIDFLDSFFDSWLMDVGTLLQDAQALWSYRADTRVDMNTVLRLMVFRDALLDEVRAIDVRYGVEAYFALLQKLMRVLPYATDEGTRQFLISKCADAMEAIEQLGGE